MGKPKQTGGKQRPDNGRRDAVSLGNPASPQLSTDSKSPQSEQTLSHPRPDAEQKKFSLEIEKLSLEIENLRHGRKWWVNSLKNMKGHEWLIGLAAIGAIIVGLWSGVFDAKSERLKVETMRLEDKKDALSQQIAAKDRELSEANAKLIRFEAEDSAIQSLRELQKKGIVVSFTVRPDFDGIGVSLSRTMASRDGKIDWAEALQPLPEPKRNPSISEALAAINRIRKLNSLQIQNLVMTADDIVQAGRHEEMEVLALENVQLDSAKLSKLPPVNALWRLNVSTRPVNPRWVFRSIVKGGRCVSWCWRVAGAGRLPSDRA